MTRDEPADPRRLPAPRGAAVVLLSIVAIVVALVGWFVADHPTPRLSVAPSDAVASSEGGGAAREPGEPLAERVEDDPWAAPATRPRRPRGRTADTDAAASDLHVVDGDVLDERGRLRIERFTVRLIAEPRDSVELARNAFAPASFRDGRFRIDHKLAGDYTVEVDAPEYEAESRAITVPLEQRLEFRLVSARSIAGVVRAADQQPAAGIDVDLEFDATSFPAGTRPPTQRRATCDEAGRYAFFKLPPGDYGVTIRSGGDVLAHSTGIDVERGRTAERDLRLPPLGGLQVRVLGAGDRPVARARAALDLHESASPSRAARTSYANLDGVAELRWLPAGRWSVAVDAPGFASHRQPIEITAGAPREVVVRLEAAADRPGGR